MTVWNSITFLSRKIACHRAASEGGYHALGFMAIQFQTVTFMKNLS